MDTSFIECVRRGLTMIFLLGSIFLVSTVIAIVIAREVSAD